MRQASYSSRSVTLATVAYDVPAGWLQLEFRTGHVDHYFGSLRRSEKD